MVIGCFISFFVIWSGIREWWIEMFFMCRVVAMLVIVVVVFVVVF